MTATKILWGQILVVFLIVHHDWGATQWVAWRLGFQAQLGSPWFEAFGTPIYPPPPSSGGGISTTPMRAGVLGGRRESRPRAGSIIHRVAINMSVNRGRVGGRRCRYLWFARWANRAEVEAAGCLGFPMVSCSASWISDYLRNDGPEQCALVSRRPGRARCGASWSRRC